MPMSVLHFLAHYLLLASLLAVLAICAILVLTRNGSRARAWLFATPDRIGWVGVGTLLLVWMAFAVYNRVTGS